MSTNNKHAGDSQAPNEGSEATSQANDELIIIEDGKTITLSRDTSGAENESDTQEESPPGDSSPDNMLDDLKTSPDIKQIIVIIVVLVAFIVLVVYLLSYWLF
jgi:hypothetical protein